MIRVPSESEAAPAVPGWFAPGDPWLTKNMRHLAEVTTAERDLGTGLEQALAVFLSAAHARVLGGMPKNMTASGAVMPPNTWQRWSNSPLLAAGMPDLANWPDRDSTWYQALARFVFGLLRGLFSRRFRSEVDSVDVTITIDWEPYADDYIDQVWARLRPITDEVFAAVRAEIAASVAEGASEQTTRERISDLLDINAPSQGRANEIARLERTIADPGARDSVRREARSRLATVRRRKDQFGARWWPRVRQVARTEAVGVLNAGSFAGGQAFTHATGEPRYKRWASLEDGRVRPAHAHAHGQVQPLGEHFTVGGFPMLYPGDPKAPPDLVVNCRCSLVLLTAREAKTEQARALARGTDSDGPALTAAVAPEGGTSPMETDVTKPATEPQEDDLPPLLADAAAVPDSAHTVRWRGVLAPLGVRSGDNRMLMPPPGAAEVRNLPLPLLYQDKTGPGHDNAVVVGNIDKVWTTDGMLMGEGNFDLGDDDAREVVRQIDGGFHRWVSIRLDNATYNYQCFRDGEATDCAELEMALANGTLTDTSGIEQVQVATKWRLMSATLVAEPAFQEATIGLIDDDVDEALEGAEPDGGEGGAGQPSGKPAGDGEPDGDEVPKVVVIAASATDDREWTMSAEGEDVFAVLGDTTLPIADKTKAWDGVAAAKRIVTWASSGGKLDSAKMGKGFLYQSGAPFMASSYQFPIADVLDGKLTIIPKGVFAAAAVLRGSRGGTKIAPADQSAMKAKLNTIYSRMSKQFDDDSITPPWKSSVIDAHAPIFAAMMASAAPVRPPAEWFTDPKLDKPTPLTVTEDGRIYGHAAAWGTAHVGYMGRRVTPPRNADYTRFHHGVVRTAEERDIAVGTIVLGADHAGVEDSTSAAISHYAHSGWGVAVVRAGEDAHGVWIAGALTPEVDEFRLAALRRCSLSGDWRSVDGRPSFIAALAVNVPGFGIPRECTDDRGETVALVAAGVIVPERGTEAQPVAAKAGLGPEPEEWGRRAFAGWREAEEADKAARAEAARQQAFAAAVASMRDRVNKPRVEALKRRMAKARG